MSVQSLNEACPSSFRSALEDRMMAVATGAGPLKDAVLRAVSSHGKRLRPYLLREAALACSPYDSPSDDAILDLACAIELIHTASLIHDDILDSSVERRGQPTLHTSLGTHAAVLAGDYLFTKAFAIAQDYSHLRIPRILIHATSLTLEGEAAQDLRLFDPDVKEKEYLSNISKKTAALIGAACRCGALLAGAGEHVQRQLLLFGLELGSAFQIADDLSDLVSNPTFAGKPRGQDLSSGIMTLSLILAMSTPAGNMIRKAFEARKVSQEDAAKICDEAVRGGCICQSREYAKRLLKRAEERLSCLPDSPHSHQLRSLVAGLSCELNR